jgi:predicted HAD superfamily Cof-like phosphohydrolase|tara:strand:- start:3830 stop:4279 length:450 start_codon:yes stop_codon:yes gene_type:complete
MKGLNMNLNSSKWVNDIERMHAHYKVNEWVTKQLETGDNKKLRQLLAFRLDFIEEEFDETLKAFVDGDAKEIVDGLIDIIVIAIGTLDIFNCDAENAWQEVYEANMKKEVGVKPGRPNPLGLPDLIKPADWVGPDHTNNTGILTRVFNK